MVSFARLELHNLFWIHCFSHVAGAHELEESGKKCLWHLQYAGADDCLAFEIPYASFFGRLC